MIDTREPRPAAPVAAPVRIREADPSYTIVSKRKLIQLVNDKVVTGWTTRACRPSAASAGADVPASALRSFAIGVGVTKFISLTDMAVFDHAIARTSTNAPCAPRRPASAQADHHESVPHHYEELDASTIRRSKHRHAQDSVWQHALHRARRLHGNPAAEVLPFETRR